MTVLPELLEMTHAFRLFGKLRKLVPLAEEKTFAEGDLVLGEGEQSSFLHLITSGEVALETTVGGACVRVQTLGRGETIGWSALTSAARTLFRARALTPVSTIALRSDHIRDACERDLALGYELMKRIVELVTERLDMTRLSIASNGTV